MKVHGIGRLVADPEMRSNPEGTVFANFKLAWDRGIGDNKKTSFVPFVAAGKNAENIGKFFTKGKLIEIKVGELQQRSWDDQDGKKHYITEVFVEQWGFCGDGNKTKDPNDNLDAPPSDQINEDDLPF